MARFSILASLVCAASCSGLAQSVNPVTKVVKLLDEMIVELTHEGEADEELYEEMGCWCETNDKAKTKAIADGNDRIKALGSSIQSLTSTSANLNSQIKALSAEVVKNEEAMASATALRKTQLVEFNAEEKDMLASITSMKGAVTALSKHQEASFLQESSTRRSMSLASLRLQLQRHALLVNEVISSSQQSALNRYFEIEQPALIQTQAQAPQSGQIFGILTGMKESFEKNLANSQKEETENNAAYEDLKSAKLEEIAAGKSQSETKTQELAAADVKHAVDKQDFQDTEDTLEVDVKFLANVKSKCESLDKEFGQRKQTRQEEIKAVGKALSFLNSDEAHDLFTRTLSFLQTQTQALRRTMVAKLLARTSRHHRNPRMALLQASLRNAAFAKVVEQIRDMIDSLTQEQKDEVALRDLCIEEFNANTLATEAQKRDESELSAKIASLESTVADLDRDMEALKKANAEALVDIKRAGEDRAKQNKEFQVTVADQRATQRLIKGALSALQGFYGFVQEGQPEFESQEKNKKSGGVMGMMQEVISDAKHLEAEAIQGEEDSQKAYETFVKDTNESVFAMKKDLVNKSRDRSDAEADRVERSGELDQTKTELSELGQASADLHARCDYTMKNFELRQSARNDEIGSLKQAMHVMGGGAFIQFLQNPQ